VKHEKRTHASPPLSNHRNNNSPKPASPPTAASKLTPTTNTVQKTPHPRQNRPNPLPRQPNLSLRLLLPARHSPRPATRQRRLRHSAHRPSASHTLRPTNLHLGFRRRLQLPHPQRPLQSRHPRLPAHRLHARRQHRAARRPGRAAHCCAADGCGCSVLGRDV
jgi:hypothetical protein